MMWYYVLVCCVGAAFLGWVGFIVGLEVGQRRADSGYEKGREDALSQVRQMVDKHQVKDVGIAKATKDKEGKKESAESPKSQEPPVPQTPVIIQ